MVVEADQPGTVEAAPTEAAASDQAAAGGTTSVRRDSLILMASTVVVGVANWGFTLAILWFLPPGQFSEVAALSSLLLVMGTAANASLPWVLARRVVQTVGREIERAEAVGFTLLAGLASGTVAALVVVGLSARYATPGPQAAAAFGTFCLFGAAVGAGYLQGLQRYLVLAALTVTEVLIKLGVGIGLASAGGGATGAVGGAALAASLWLVTGLWIVRGRLRWPRMAVVGPLVRDAASIGGVQTGVALLANLDIVVGAMVLGRSRPLATYQAMLVFARVPLFTSTAVSIGIYAKLVAKATERARSVELGEALRIYLYVSAVSMAAVATLPRPVLAFVLPGGYAVGEHLLLPLAIAGLAIGLINLFTTYFQATARFTAPTVVLGVAVVAAVLLYWQAAVRSVTTLAWTAAAVTGAAALCSLVVLWWRDRGGRVLLRCAVGLGATGASYVALRAARPHLVLWFAVAAALGVAALVATQVGRTRPRADAEAGRRGRRGGRRTRASVPPPAPHRRVVRKLGTRVVKRARPLLPPTGWEALLAVSSLGREGPAIAPPYARRALVIAPHPDDETIGCGGTAALLARQGTEVRVLVATDGQASVDEGGRVREVADLRRERVARSCAALGLGPPSFVGLADGRVAAGGEVLVASLAEAARFFDPEVVFVPWPLDDHPDHRAVAACLAQVLLPADVEVWCYEVWSSLPANRIVDVTEGWEAKTRALAQHHSDQGAFDLDAHLALQRWRSIHGLFGHGYAEAFLALSASEYTRVVAGMSR